MNTHQINIETNNQNPAICPVILAGQNALDMWPLSRIRLPIAFQKNAGFSAFENIMQGLNLVHHSMKPIVLVPSTSAQMAKQQMENCNFDATTIVEPLDRGSLNAALVAALTATKSNPDCLLLFINANEAPQDWSALHRFCQSTMASPYYGQNLIVTGQPVAKNIQTHSVVKGQRTEDPNLYTFTRSTGEQEQPSFKTGSIMVASASNFLNRCETLWPKAIMAAKRTLANQRVMHNALWPDLNAWSSLEEADLFEATAQHDPNLLLRPLDLGSDTPKAAGHDETMVFEANTDHCTVIAQDHVVALCGVENLRVVTTADATLIMPNDRPVDKTPLIEEMKRKECPELYNPSVRNFPWGSQRELAGGGDHRIMRLTLIPNSEIEPHSHNQREEAWEIVQGMGSVTLDGITQPVQAGSQIKIPVGTCHSLKNTGSYKMIVVEIRRGRVLTSRDHIPAPKEQESSVPSLSPAL